MSYSFLLFGAAFGFLLSRAGATTFDFYAKLFLLQDFQLLWVIATAAAVGASGVFLLKRFRAHALDGQPLSYEGKPMRHGLVIGALLFGIGWGLSGSCPGTAPAMLGEGKLLAGFTLLGILLGTYVYGRLHGREKGGD